MRPDYVQCKIMYNVSLILIFNIQRGQDKVIKEHILYFFSFLSVKAFQYKRFIQTACLVSHKKGFKLETFIIVILIHLYIYISHTFSSFLKCSLFKRKHISKQCILEDGN